MIKLHHGVVFLLFLLISVITLVGCVNFHHVNFINKACITPYNRYDYTTCEPLHVKIDGETHIVPKNFKTDLASIPRPLWSFFAPQYSGFIAPAILHDYLYRCHTTTTRKFADDVLYSSLIEQGVTKLTATKFYLAVRVFGVFSYGDKNRNC